MWQCSPLRRTRNHMCPQMLPQLFNIGCLIMIWDLLGAIGACTVACTVAICILSLTGASQFASVFEEGGEVVVMVVLLVEVVMVVVVEGELLAICIGFRRRRSILPCRLGQAKAVKQTFTSLSHFHFRRLSNYSTFRSRCVGNTLVVSLAEGRRQQLRPQTTNTRVLGPKVPRPSQDFPA